MAEKIISAFNVQLCEKLEYKYICPPLKKSEYTDVEFRKVKPVDYKLFQVVYLVCSM